jgi:hypothetical protein
MVDLILSQQFGIVAEVAQKRASTWPWVCRAAGHKAPGQMPGLEDSKAKNSRVVVNREGTGSDTRAAMIPSRRCEPSFVRPI